MHAVSVSLVWYHYQYADNSWMSVSRPLLWTPAPDNHLRSKNHRKSKDFQQRVPDISPKWAPGDLSHLKKQQFHPLFLAHTPFQTLVGHTFQIYPESNGFSGSPLLSTLSKPYHWVIANAPFSFSAFVHIPLSLISTQW